MAKGDEVHIRFMAWLEGSRGVIGKVMYVCIDAHVYVCVLMCMYVYVYVHIRCMAWAEGGRGVIGKVMYVCMCMYVYVCIRTYSLHGAWLEGGRGVIGW